MIGAYGDGDLESPFVMWENIFSRAGLPFSGGVLTSTGVTNPEGMTGFETYDITTFAALGKHVQIVLDNPAYCDCIALAGHNLQLFQGGYFRAQYSPDGTGTWADLPLLYPTDATPGAVIFARTLARGWRFRVFREVGAIQVAVGAIGERLALPGFLNAPYTPSDFSVRSEVQIAQSMGGHYLGASQYPAGRRAEISISALPRSLVEGERFAAFRDHFNAGNPFWFGGSPLRMPRDLAYVWRGGDELAVTYRPGNALADLQMTVAGYGA